jgi:hypothetical protein
MSTEVRQFKPDDYEPLKTWWSKRDMVAPTKDMLTDGIGCIVNMSGVDIAAAWVYFMAGSTSTCLITFLVSNPSVCESKSTHIATNHLINVLQQIAKDQGYVNAICITSSSGLTRMMASDGWKAENINHVILHKTL